MSRSLVGRLVELLRDPERLAALDAHDRPEAFEAAFGERLPDRSINLPLGDAPLGCWTPETAALVEGRWRIPLVWAGERPFVMSFSEDDLSRWRRRPLGRLLRPWIDLDQLIQLGESLTAPAPAGVIFHLSRCGSTLLARMLGAIGGGVVLAEAPPVEAMIGAGRQDAALEATRQVRAMRAMVALMGRDRATSGAGRGPVLKLDSWSLLDLELVCRAFPGAPMVVLHRDPLAILASHARRPGRHTVPGLIDWRCEPPTTDSVEHGARLLGALCEAAISAVGRGARALSYETLVAMTPQAVAGLFDLRPGPGDAAAMEAVRAADAKAPHQAFDRRLAAQAGDAGPALVMAADRWARPAWRALAALG